MATRPEYILAPFTVIIDSREQHPFSFTGYKADAPHKDLPFLIPTVVKGLKTGDYSIEGYEDKITIERKDLPDAYNTFCAGRERFERELSRLAAMEFAAVVVEAGWDTVINRPPPHSRFKPKSFFRSVNAWEIEYPNIRWEFAPTRNWAERRTLRWLQRYWQVQQYKAREGAQVVAP